MATIAEKLKEAAVVDNLNRNEDPIAGEWKLLKPGITKGKAEAAKGWTPKSTKAEGFDGAYWNKTSLVSTAAIYAYAIVSFGVLATQAERVTGLWLLRDKTTPETVQSGYYLRAERKAGSNILFKLEKWVTGTPTVLKEIETTTYTAVSARIAIVVGNGTVYFFASKSTSPETFEEVLKKEDATYSEGYSGLMATGTGEFSVLDFRTGTFSLEEEAGIHKPNSASVSVSAPTPEISAGIAPNSSTVNASIPSVELAGGPAPSATEREAKGLPLPYPNVLANPGRLGPPRFTARDRKTLGLD